jgi:hypothetical protein
MCPFRCRKRNVWHPAMDRRSGGGRARAPPNLCHRLPDSRKVFLSRIQERQAPTVHHTTQAAEPDMHMCTVQTCAGARVAMPRAWLPSAQAQPIRHDANSRAMGDHWRQDGVVQ